jgi:hypothetical protein
MMIQKNEESMSRMYTFDIGSSVFKRNLFGFVVFLLLELTTGGIHMSWLKASGSRGDWTKAKEGENFHGYSNKENEKPLETLFKMAPGDNGSIGKFFTPAPKNW